MSPKGTGQPGLVLRGRFRAVQSNHRSIRKKCWRFSVRPN